MPIKIRVALLPVLLLWAAVASSETTLPSDVTFARPRVTDEITKLVMAQKDPQASTAIAPQIDVEPGVDAPMPVFRTLAEAARAGVSPQTPPEKLLADSELLLSLPVRIHSDDEPEGKAVWPAAFGALSLMACGFIAFVTMVTMRLRPRPVRVDE